MLGSPFSSDPFSPPPNPLILVVSGPSGVGKDAVIKVRTFFALSTMKSAVTIHSLS